MNVKILKNNKPTSFLFNIVIKSKKNYRALYFLEIKEKHFGIFCYQMLIMYQQNNKKNHNWLVQTNGI